MRALAADQLKQLFPGLSRAKCALYAPHFSAALEEAKINTRQRACAFIAQLGHESQDLAHLKEIWGPTAAQYRYDVRTDLGNTPERDGDGKKYLGRGGLQRTGKTNYRRAAEALGLPLLDHPELLEKPEHAFRSDALYWNDHKLNKLADRLTLRGDAQDLKQLDKITKAINGGYNGRVDRQRRYLVAIANLPAELFEPEEEPTPPSALDRVSPPIIQTPEPAKEEGEKKGDVLLAKLSKNEGVKSAGASFARRLGVRLGGPLGLLVAALEAGNIYVWLGVAVLVLGAGAFAYYKRREIRQLFKKLTRELL